MPYKDPEAQRAYQRQWTARRREEWLAEHGPCVQCGSSESLEIDHIDPNQKISHRVFSWNQQKRDAELTKCQVLCNTCHKRKTASSYDPPAHGTESRYCNPRYRCRCAPCTESHRLEKNRRRAIRRAAGLPVT